MAARLLIPGTVNQYSMPVLLQYTLAGCLLFLSISCNHTADCREVALNGQEAIGYIQAFDTVIPNTTLIIPDSIVQSSTQEIKAVLDTMAARHILSYRLTDSTTGTRRLTGPNISGPDTIMLYRYTISWDRTFVPEYPEHGHHNVISASFLGRDLHGEVRYRGRTIKLRKMVIAETDSPYFRQTCNGASFRYKYTLLPLNGLAKAITLNNADHMERIKTDGEPAH